MSIKINERVRRVQGSMTLALSAKAKAMASEGIDVIGFAAGEPDFDTPAVIREHAHKDIDRGLTRYTEASGMPELKRAICAKLKRENGLEYKPEQVIVSCGAKHSLYNIFETMLEAGDEVILPAPYWLSYPEIVQVAGGTVVPIGTDAASGYKITPEQLEAAITDKTVALIFNSPGNPTGTLYTPDEIRALAAVLEPHPNVTVVSDEIYERLIYGGSEHLSFAAASPSMLERTITVNGMSKTYAMTGWRIGYAAGPAEFVKAMGRLQSHSTSNPVTFCQTAAVAALELAESDVQTMREAFDGRRKLMLERLAAIEGVVCPEPLGAFYVFPDVSALYERAGVGGSIAFCEKLLTEANVVCVPGLPFGDDRSIRLSYACATDVIEEGLRRIAEWVEGL